ncbi:MAG: carbon-nitrogen hydrolase family protein [Thermoanaerobaculia bacterium]|jgi:predicted amidohydrolase
MKRFVAAAVQMTSTEDRERNLEQAFALVDRAVERGAEFVALPENVDMIGPHGPKVAAAEPLDGPTFLRFKAKAKEKKIWLLAGSLAEVSTQPGKARNTSVLYGPEGKRVAVYRKIHLFDVDLDDGTRFRESDVVEAGTEVVIARTKLATFGMTICYDLRFPELYRALVTNKAEVLLVPSAFTLQTGKDHWEVLLRARAIENTTWLIAPAQTGEHGRGRRSFGNAMIVDPWGTVVARCSEGPGICVAEIDPAVLEATRAAIPSLKHRKLS